MPENKPTNQASNRSENLYDFSHSPLWKDYFNKTRSNAKFPRGYKEVSIYS